MRGVGPPPPQAQAMTWRRPHRKGQKWGFLGGWSRTTITLLGTATTRATMAASPALLPAGRAAGPLPTPLRPAWERVEDSTRGGRLRERRGCAPTRCAAAPVCRVPRVTGPGVPRGVWGCNLHRVHPHTRCNSHCNSQLADSVTLSDSDSESPDSRTPCQLEVPLTTGHVTRSPLRARDSEY